jgi:hypothetical protein
MLVGCAVSAGVMLCAACVDAGFQSIIVRQVGNLALPSYLYCFCAALCTIVYIRLRLDS